MAEDKAMATVTNRRQIAELNPPEKGIGFPLFRGPEGAMCRRLGLNDIADDIVHLLHTNPGEYPNDPEYGAGLRTYLFELQDANLAIRLEGLIERQFTKYIKIASLVQVNVSVGNDDKSITISVFARRSTGKKDIIRVVIKMAEESTIIFV